MDQQVMKLVDESSNAAIDADQRGDSATAIVQYEKAAEYLSEAMNTVPSDSAMYRSLSDRQRSLLERMHYLKQTVPGGDGRSTRGAQGTATKGPKPAKLAGGGGHATTVAAGALGALGGGLILGPIGAIVAGAGVAYAATRTDKVGQIARSAGDAGLGAVDRARELDHDYEVTTKATNATKDGCARANEWLRRNEVGRKVADSFTKFGTWSQSLFDNCMGGSQQHRQA